jgi:hypothetical protein
MVNSLKDRFAGNREGFLELERFVVSRREDLSLRVKELDEQDQINAKRN